jgi:hypothetical protein
MEDILRYICNLRTGELSKENDNLLKTILEHFIPNSGL